MITGNKLSVPVLEQLVGMYFVLFIVLDTLFWPITKCVARKFYQANIWPEMDVIGLSYSAIGNKQELIIHLSSDILYTNFYMFSRTLFCEEGIQFLRLIQNWKNNKVVHYKAGPSISEPPLTVTYIVKDYIENDGEFCLNISDKTRNNTLHLYQTLEHPTYAIFEEAFNNVMNDTTGMA
eukprot:Pgem_evm2s4270